MNTQLQALELWRRTLLASVRGAAPDLSARQMALLFCVFLTEGPHTVRGLAETLNISKPAISRALDRLGELGYIRRERDELDRRNVLVRRMPKGAAFLNEFAGLFAKAETEVVAIPADKVPDYVVEAAQAAMADVVAGEDMDSSEDISSNWVDAVA
ncbi:MAG: MarR family transcriptional regulator [Bdellovibrionales bacterium]